MTNDNRADRITVTLIKKSRTALDSLTESTGLSTTDVTNRAIQLYHFVQEIEAAEGHLLIQWASGDGERVRFL